MICAVIRGPSFAEAHAQIVQAGTDADSVELRLDGFHSLDGRALAKLLAACTIPAIFTLRKRSQGGLYAGSERERLAHLLQLARLAPAYLDLESEVPTPLIRKIATQYPHLKLILSHHDFKGMPENLDALYDALTQTPACLYKIAVTPSHNAETVTFMEWAKRKKNRLIAIAMGREAAFSRILTATLGHPMHYASLEEEPCNSLGQFSTRMLLQRYDYRRITAHSAFYGLIGDPLDHSPSDCTHNHVFQHLGVNARYVKIPLRPAALPQFLRMAKKLPLSGLSVTMPLKSAIVPLLDKLDPHAREIGAVNTLLFENGEVIGYNTDGVGALNALEQQETVAGKRLVVLGTGGAARAIAYEAGLRGGIVTLLNREQAKAKAVARCLGCAGESVEAWSSKGASDYDVLINCTPVPWPIDADAILPGTLVMDITLSNLHPPLLREAAARGCRTLGGSAMFGEQALKQFEIWLKGRCSPLTIRSCLNLALSAYHARSQ